MHSPVPQLRNHRVLCQDRSHSLRIRTPAVILRRRQACVHVLQSSPCQVRRPSGNPLRSPSLSARHHIHFQSHHVRRGGFLRGNPPPGKLRIGHYQMAFLQSRYPSHYLRGLPCRLPCWCRSLLRPPPGGRACCGPCCRLHFPQLTCSGCSSEG